jgi:glycosyltransferase involved in cell wall biosynthesis
MRFSIIIVTNNRVELVKNSLFSIENQTFRDFETIVVDDGSSMIIENELNRHHFSFPLIFHRNNHMTSCSCARNCGLKKATGEIVVFIDSGLILIPGYLENYNKHYLNIGRNCSLSGYTYYLRKDIGPVGYNTSEFLQQIEKGEVILDQCDIRKWYKIIREEERWKCFIGNNCSCYLEDALAIDGFYEHFRGWGPDDIEFAYRLKKRLGRNICMFSDILSYHMWHPHSSEQQKMESFLVNNKIFSDNHPELVWTGIMPVKHYRKFLAYSGVDIQPEQEKMLVEIEEKGA